MSNTVGQEAYNRLISGETQEVGETSLEMNKTFEENLMDCIIKYQKERLEPNNPFYAVVLHKKERLMCNVVRRYFFCRESEPTPDYDQIVFHVEPKTMQVNFKWVIPDITTYTDMVLNGASYPKDKQHLVHFCKAMAENRLADYQKLERGTSD